MYCPKKEAATLKDRRERDLMLHRDSARHVWAARAGGTRTTEWSECTIVSAGRKRRKNGHLKDAEAVVREDSRLVDSSSTDLHST